MDKQEPSKFGVWDAVELLGLILIGAGTWSMWGKGAAMAIVGAIVFFVCLLARMRTTARDGAERRAD